MNSLQTNPLPKSSHAAESLTLSIIIVSYNTRELTLRCLRALYGSMPDRDAEVWVVDNASSDQTVEAIRASFPQVHLLVNARNVGFGAANNQAMAQAHGEFFLLLNSDAFVEAHTITLLAEHLCLNPRVAVAGPRLYNDDGSLQVSCFRFPSPARAWLENLWISTALAHHPVLGDYRRWLHDTVRKVDFVIGACMLVRRSAYEEVGGFDEAFFMYGEETDWQRRMHNAGWEIVFVPQARALHLGGASGASQQPFIEKQFFDSLDYYERKHHGLLGLISLRCAMAVGCFCRFLLWSAVSVIPAKRPHALARARRHSRLLLRQTLHWN